MSNTPSLTELHSLASQHTYSVAEPTRYVTDTVAFARAVLAKWGTPQPGVREPTCKDYLTVEVLVLPNAKGRGQFSWEPQDERYWVKLSTQPVVREPLSHKELQAISLDYSDSEDECTGFRDGWRFAEKHYGITQRGGSNGL